MPAGRQIRLEIDGGVKVDNIAAIAAAGADTFVAGSAIFGQKDYGAVITAMKQNIQEARNRNGLTSKRLRPISSSSSSSSLS